MLKVRCRSCKNETNGKCSIKKKSVKLNKKRMCDFYDFDVTKVKAKEKPEVRRVPALKEDRKKLAKKNLDELKKYLEREQKEQELKKEKLLKEKASKLYDLKNKYVGNTGDPKYPLSGDLSRFKTSGD